MAARTSLFPRWSNAVLWSVLALAGLSAIGLPSVAIAWARTPYATGQDEPVAQPVEFDHRHHFRDDGIECAYCHADASRSRYAGVPATKVCMGCHAQIWTDSARLAPVRQSWLTGEPIRWQRVNRLPDFVYLDHRPHVTKGVACERCHGRVDLMAKVYAAAPLTMRWCLDCHRNPDASLGNVAPRTDCSACHR